MKLYFFIILVLISASSFAQLKTYEFEQIDSLQNIEKRTVIVFIHTDWCKYCQAMKTTTFKNEKVVERINRQFYFVSFNAEEKRDIVFGNRTFTFKPSGTNTGIHELAEQLGTVEKETAFPTLCFLNTANEIVFQYPQFINQKDLLAVMARIK